MIGGIIMGIAALAGGIISGIGNSIGRHQRTDARNIAIATARRESIQGQHQVTMNTLSFTQDLTMIVANSGVSADFGTARQKRQLAYQANIAQINNIEEDFQDFKAHTEADDRADRINTGFSIFGGMLGATANAVGQFAAGSYKKQTEDYYQKLLNTNYGKVPAVRSTTGGTYENNL